MGKSSKGSPSTLHILHHVVIMAWSVSLRSRSQKHRWYPRFGLLTLQIHKTLGHSSNKTPGSKTVPSSFGQPKLSLVREDSSGTNRSHLGVIDLQAFWEVPGPSIYVHSQPHSTAQCLIKHLNLDLIGYLLCAKNSKLLFINDIIIKSQHLGTVR